MKKYFFTICLILIFLIIAGCNAKNAPLDSNSIESSLTTQQLQSTQNNQKTEKTVDSVAKYLGLSNGETQYYDMIGALDGKGYGEGDNAVEIYLFDESSESYQAIINNELYVKPAAYKDGIVLVFPNNENQEILDKFNKIEF